MPPEPILIPEENAPERARRAYGIGGVGPVSFALICLSVAVALYSNLGGSIQSLLPLFISEHAPDAGNTLLEVRHGQVWRLITPAFIHFGVIHLVFNMMWVKDLGTAIERRHGPGYFLALTALIVGASNVAQYFVGGPIFGGMSGAVYGWFGYVWLRGQFDPRSGFHVPRNLVFWMIGWFIACVVGVIPHVANTAHSVGLAMGAFIGWATALRARRSELRSPLSQVL